MIVLGILQVTCSSCYSTNSVKVLKCSTCS